MKLSIFLFLLSCTLNILAQSSLKGDTLKIHGETIEIEIPELIIKVEENTPVEEIKQVETSIQKVLDEYMLEMQDLQFISDNVVTEVDIEMVDKALKLGYSYSLLNDTLKFQTDDFGLGKYRIDDSNAMQVTLSIMKKTIEGQLIKFVSPQKEISITISGSADATRIQDSITYNGEYGNNITEICGFKEKTQTMNVSTQQGITDNHTLAFLRSYAVKDYIGKNINPLKSTRNTWYHTATLREQQGDEQQRVSIELIVFNAFEE